MGLKLSFTPTRSTSDDSIVSSFLSSPATSYESVLELDSASSNSPIVFSKLSSRLRLATMEVHEEVMIPKIVGKLTKGELPRSIYRFYLSKLLQVYTELEHALSLHSTHVHLSKTYDPEALSRSAGLQSDIDYFEGEELMEDNGEGTSDYIARLKELGESDEPTLLLAHSYVRYLGDLSGGQIISKAVRKNYRLPATGEGASFYEFYPLSTSESIPLIATFATNTELKALKTWFREGLDIAGENMTENQILAVIEEAKSAFRLNLKLFQSFELQMNELETETVESSDELWKIVKEDQRVTKKRGIDLVEDLEVQPAPATSLFTFAGVAAAASLTAFIIGRDYI